MANGSRVRELDPLLPVIIANGSDVPLLKKHGEEVLVMGQKHAGKTIEMVAKEDPAYLTWLRTGDRLAHTPDDVFFKLQQVMELFGIPSSTRRK